MANKVLVVNTPTGQMLHYSTDGQATVCSKPVKAVLSEAGVEYNGRVLWANCRKCEKHNARLFR